MNRKEFSRAVAEQGGMTYRDSAWATDTIFSTLKNLLKTSEDKIVIPGFGVFRSVERQPKPFRHPTTGELQIRQAYKTVKFTASEKLIEDFNDL